MFCKNCGKEIKSTDKFCDSCGALVEASDNSAVNAPFNEIPVEQPVVEQSAPATPMGAPEAPAAPVEPAPTYNEPVGPAPAAAPVEPTIKPVEPTPVVTDPVIGTTPVAQPKKGGNKGFIIIVIILGAIILGAGGFIGYKLLFDKKDTPTVEPGTPSTPSTPSTPTTPEPTATEDSNSYTAGNYKFTVPTGFVKKDSNGTQTILVGPGVNILTLTADNSYTYDFLKTNLYATAQGLLESWASDSYAYVEHGEATPNGSKALYIQFYSQQKALYGDAVMIALSDGSVLYAELFYKTEDGATTGYNALAETAKTAVKNTSSTYSKSTTKPYESFKAIDSSKLELK